MPTDIGEVSLATRIMFTKRDGLPRSWTRATIENPRAPSAPRRPVRRSTPRPVTSAPAAMIEEPAASPPAKKYAGMSASQGDALTMGRP